MDRISLSQNFISFQKRLYAMVTMSANVGLALDQVFKRGGTPLPANLFPAYRNTRYIL